MSGSPEDTKISDPKDVSTLYDPLKYSFMIAGIDIFGENSRRNQKKRRFMLIYFHVTSALAVLAGATFLVNFYYRFDPQLFSPLLLFLNGLILRHMLYTNKSNIIHQINLMCSFRLSTTLTSQLKKFRRKTFIAFMLVIISSAIFIAINIANVFLSKNKYHRKSFVTVVLMKIHPGLLSYHTSVILIINFFCSLLPSFMFSFLYGTVSWHLKHILIQTRRSLQYFPFLFDTNHSIYLRASSLVHLVDKKLKTVAFFAVFQLSSLLYFASFNSLSQGLKFEIFTIVASLNVTLVLLPFYWAFSNAAEIPLINEEILSDLLESPLNHYAFGKRLSLTLLIQKGLQLTVSGIPVGKSTFMVLIGTIMTYSLLVQSFSETSTKMK